MTYCDKASANVRAVVHITGTVQGVGFRPFLYRLARQHGLTGRVANGMSGVRLEVEGSPQKIDVLLEALHQQAPPLARIDRIETHYCPPIGHNEFVIADSDRNGPHTAQISPDIGICEDCLRELFDPSDRRYRYAFINCTNCGPRYTILRSVPYDRANTSMACFAMCAACRAEYDDPANRRFHAQPNACPQCGPHVWLVDPENRRIVGDHRRRESPSSDPVFQRVAGQPIEETARLLYAGRIVAVKGLGGFHLACDARNAEAVDELRRRKHRDEKPLAVMVPDLSTARRLCRLTPEAEALLASPQRPITLLRRQPDAPVADSIAPGHPQLGLMLPYTPLHYLLMSGPDHKPRFTALVMTSGNVSEEPIVVGNREALHRLRHLADGFLLHNRDIDVRADDSVVQPEPDGRFIIRRSRGYVPAPIAVHRKVGPTLAVGGQLKNTVALSRGREVFLSQHLGDPENLETFEFLKDTVAHLQRIVHIEPSTVAHDLHPEYLSTRLAESIPGVRRIGVQHHHAHIAACMAEHGLDGPVIGVVLDGTGYGTDGTIWGGEILLADYRDFRRAAHLRPVPLPGSEQAVRQPWRTALSHLDAAYAEELWNLPIPFVQSLDDSSARLVLQATRQGVNSPLTSSMGRLFDAVAALCDGRREVSYEGQAAIELEALSRECRPPARAALEFGRSKAEGAYSALVTEEGDSFVMEPAPLIRDVVENLRRGISPEEISLRFHRTLVRLFKLTVLRIAEETGLRQVILSGGCFQNRFLTRHLTAVLQEEGLLVFTHHKVPTNDGGLALGQVMVAAENR